MTENKLTSHEPQLQQLPSIQSLNKYTLLGRSGLRVSPLCLGTGGNFGDLWCPKWITDRVEAERVLNRFVDAGGNFIDTADSYHTSEEILGSIIKKSFDRDRLVIATKFSFGMHQNDPNGGGNGRKHIMQAVESSLKRLNMDYIDLYWLHAWDTVTPVEEVMSTLNNLVQSGKIRYIGLSNIPAWYLGRAQTLAELRGWEKICGLQLEYSLLMRNIEFEYIKAAKELGIGVCAWGPLANGLLTGKYNSSEKLLEGNNRLTHGGAIDPTLDPKNQSVQAIIQKVIEIAKILNRTPAQIALNWISHRPGVASTLVGVSDLLQLEENLNALEFEIPPDLTSQLDELSKLITPYPYFFHTGDYLDYINAHAYIASGK